MVTPVLSLASGVMPEASPLELIAAAGAAGWQAVGLWIEPERFTHDYLCQVQRALDASGLRVLDAEVIWLRPGPLDPQHLRALDIARTLGAEHVLTVSSDPDHAATAAKLGALCDHAGDSLRVVLEFGAFTEVRNLTQAGEIIQQADRPNLGMLIDTLHWHRSGSTLEQIRTLPPQWLTYAQLCDAGGPGPDIEDKAAVRLEAVDFRLLPGDGDLPLEAWLQALPVNLPLSLEIRSLSLRSACPDFTERARVVLEHTRRWLKSSKAVRTERFC